MAAGYVYGDRQMQTLTRQPARHLTKRTAPPKSSDGWRRASAPCEGHGWGTMPVAPIVIRSAADDAPLLPLKLSLRAADMRPQRPRAAQLSPGTFCTFLREFSSFQASNEVLTGSDRDPGYGSAHLRVPMGGPWFFRLRRRTYSPRVPVVERRSALRGHAAASTDGHVSHDADRLSAGRV